MSHFLVVLAISASVPSACLGLLLWLAWLEETLPVDARRAQRRSSPEPILAIPAQRQPLRAVPSSADVPVEVEVTLAPPAQVPA